MGSVWRNVAAHRGVHGVVELAILQTTSNHRRHAADKSEAGVGVGTGGCRLVTLSDKICDPPHESTHMMHYHRTFLHIVRI
jgi:hypothetical protein